MGYLLLEGGAEFGGAMRDPDLAAINLAGGMDAPIRIIPTAAAPDNNHQRAGGNGVRWFQSLGARDVKSLPLIDDVSANDAEVVSALREAKLIYMLGGFTHYLAQTLLNSKAWNAVLTDYKAGAVVAGSSAGAMVMCEYYFDPREGRVQRGLNLVSNACVLPHYNIFGKHWATNLQKLLPDATLLGIDERTGMLNTELGWQVLGAGVVTLYRNDQIEVYKTGQEISL